MESQRHISHSMGCSNWWWEEQQYLFIVIKKLEAISIFCQFTPCYAVDHDGNINGFVGDAEKTNVNKFGL